MFLSCAWCWLLMKCQDILGEPSFEDLISQCAQFSFSLPAFFVSGPSAFISVAGSPLSKLLYDNRGPMCRGPAFIRRGTTRHVRGTLENDTQDLTHSKVLWAKASTITEIFRIFVPLEQLGWSPFALRNSDDMPQTFPWICGYRQEISFFKMC